MEIIKVCHYVTNLIHRLNNFKNVVCQVDVNNDKIFIKLVLHDANLAKKMHTKAPSKKYMEYCINNCIVQNGLKK